MIFPGDGGHLRLIGQRGGVYDAVASMVRALRVQWLRALRVWPRRDVGCWVWKVLLEACSDMFRFVFPFEELLLCLYVELPDSLHARNGPGSNQHGHKCLLSLSTCGYGCSEQQSLSGPSTLKLEP